MRAAPDFEQRVVGGRLASGQEAVKDRYRQKYREKSKISRKGERMKNAASKGALRRIKLEDRSFR
ncbi:hypothetical protein [Burkholderia thailandensis]|uniref:hypothetical protein n=1 Tax=Burkholderia thailandensis TaxID=57975 RepID=UPI000AFDFFB5|nr:hypothetical protein [Burkholderia thailandensis]MCS3399531.1 hypothetical protein [Burkholderia thailandensis]MCS6495629.1 hypothetical protein [Burkholderia thailandensis]MCS6514787.1 hypothetical protein [Burkholderia thailandensis]NBC93313.1 hypothetical protein [Burkholderia thailandensis]NBD07103.1 hypothetical protein [Burkholderia thailandensis]